MSVILSRNSSFLGVPLVKVRNLLKVWHRGDRSDLWHIAELKDVSLDPRTVFVLLEELRDRGLMGLVEQEYGPQEDDLTESGLALAGAHARRRVPKAQAQKVLDRFLDACAAVNARDDLPFDVREVWLFGSMIDETRDHVADIDIVSLLGRPDGFDRPAAMERFKQLAKAMGATPQVGLMRIFGDEMFVQRQLLHGGRRHPLLAMHQLDDLRDLGCPCRIVFDAGRGGRIGDSILDRHPTSTGRSERVGEQRQMPDLAASRHALRPVHASLLACRHRSYATFRALGPWPEEDPCYLIMSDVRMPIVVVDGSGQHDLKANALRKRARFPSCDGRDRFGLWLTEFVRLDPDDWWSDHEKIPKAMAVIERSIHQEGRSVSYCLDVVDADHHGQSYDFAQLLMLEWWLHLTVTTDVERIVRREFEESARFDVEVVVTNSANRRIAAALLRSPGLFGRPYVEESRARVKAPN